MSDIPLPIGTQINQYVITSVLGSGNFGMTYKAIDPSLQRYVAIKEYFPVNYATRGHDLSIYPKDDKSKPIYQWGLERFSEEAIVLAKFDHKNIVRVLQLITEFNRTAYIVMEYLEGENLEEIISKNGKMAAGDIISIFNQLLDGCEAIHNINILHRDIKPSNIMLRGPVDSAAQVERHFTPILIDFGASRDIATQKSGHSSIVTEGYSPPEQYSSAQEQSPASDIYALAATGFHMLTGEPIPSAGARWNEPLPPLPRERLVGLPKAFVPGLIHGLEMEVSKRPRSIGDWRREMGFDDRSMNQGGAKHSRRGVLIAAAATAVVASAGGAAYWATRPRGLDSAPTPLRVVSSGAVGTVGPDPFVRIVPLASGALVAAHTIADSGLRRIRLMQISENLSVEKDWKDDRDDGEAVVALPSGDGGVIAGGRVGTTAQLIRLSSDWAPTWRVERGEGRISTLLENDEGYLIGIQGIEGGLNANRARVEQLNRRGDLLWGIDFQIGPDERVEQIIPLSDGGYAVLGWGVGFRDTPQGRLALDYCWVALTDDKGNSPNRLQMHGLGNATPNAMIEAGDKIFITGQTTTGAPNSKPQMLLWTIERKGTTLSAKWSFPHTPSSGRAFALIKPRSLLYIGGWAGSPVSGRIAQIDSSGGLAWDMLQPATTGEGAIIDLALRDDLSGFAGKILRKEDGNNWLEIVKLNSQI